MRDEIHLKYCTYGFTWRLILYLLLIQVIFHFVTFIDRNVLMTLLLFCDVTQLLPAVRQQKLQTWWSLFGNRCSVDQRYELWRWIYQIYQSAWTSEPWQMERHCKFHVFYYITEQNVKDNKAKADEVTSLMLNLLFACYLIVWVSDCQSGTEVSRMGKRL